MPPETPKCYPVSFPHQPHRGVRHDMIAGRFGDEDELFFEVELIADNGLELPVDVLLDTGFSGWLAMDNLGILDFRF